MFGDLLIRWLPTFCVAFFLVLALAAVVSIRAGARRKGGWLLVIALSGTLATAATVWQQHDLRRQGKSLGRLARATGLSGSPLPKAKQIVGRATAEIDALSRETKALRSKIANLERSEKGRVISEKTAAQLIADLRQAGSHEVVVSCVWGDDEAYDYANQIVDILKRAGWQASGPEPTVIFGDAPDMALGISVPEGTAPDAAKILMDAFTKSAIPYRTRVPPAGALPSGSAVELFVSRKPRSTVGEGSTRE
jgi:hypothetical protein